MLVDINNPTEEVEMKWLSKVEFFKQSHGGKRVC